MARINIEQLRKTVLEDTNGKLTKAAFERATEIFEESKLQLIEEFDNHPVTVEIENGPESDNISDTINDPNESEDGKGNLYSFIGFEEGTGEEEINNLKQTLQEDIIIKNTPQKTSIGKIKWQFGVFVPSNDEFEKITPMPFGTGRSWLSGIERGISGIARYIYRHGIEASRSTSGIQTKKNYRSSASFVPTKYLLNMLNAFRKSFK